MWSDKTFPQQERACSVSYVSAAASSTVATPGGGFINNNNGSYIRCYSTMSLPRTSATARRDRLYYGVLIIFFKLLGLLEYSALWQESRCRPDMNYGHFNFADTERTLCLGLWYFILWQYDIQLQFGNCFRVRCLICILFVYLFICMMLLLN